MRRLLLALALLGCVWAAGAASAPAAAGCAFSVVPTTYEGAESRGAHLKGLELAGFNNIASNDTFFGIPHLEHGPRDDRGTTGDPYIPPALLKAIAWTESALWQAANAVPYQAVGPALISFDCGHGIMQVTSGMGAPAGNGIPSAQQALVATHYLYNIGRGSAILADKWNAAPDYRPVVGRGNPHIIEDWYYAVWSYNGFASINNPLNPIFNQQRSGFSCSANLNDGFTHNRGNHPYQELVFGCAARPPAVGGQRLWRPQPATLPNLTSPVWREPIGNFPDTSQMDIPSPFIQNRDSTRRPVTGTRGLLLGGADLRVTPTRVTGTTNEIEIANTGGGILPWRVKSRAGWLTVDKQAGVALGRYVPCAADAPCDRRPTLTIRVNTQLAPASGQGIVSITSPTTWERVDIRVVRGAPATPSPTPTPSPQPSPPSPQDALDSDWDGCPDTRELGTDPTRGGQRDPDDFWDFFDTPDASGTRDHQISGADLFRIAGRFGTSGDPTVFPVDTPPATGYFSAFDRGPLIGPLPWQLGPADGSIGGSELFAVIGQFGHNCA